MRARLVGFGRAPSGCWGLACDGMDANPSRTTDTQARAEWDGRRGVQGPDGKLASNKQK
jgi:hypothetical protein